MCWFVFAAVLSVCDCVVCLCVFGVAFLCVFYNVCVVAVFPGLRFVCCCLFVVFLFILFVVMCFSKWVDGVWSVGLFLLLFRLCVIVVLLVFFLCFRCCVSVYVFIMFVLLLSFLG